MKSITYKPLGLNIKLTKSMADTKIIYVNMSGNSYWSQDDKPKNRKAFAKWLRQAADMVEK